MLYVAKLLDGGEDGKGRSRRVELVTGSTHEVVLDGRSLSFDAQPAPGGSWSVIGPDGRHAEARVSSEADGRVRVQIGPYAFTFDLQDDLTARALATTGARGARRGGDVKAAMPGRVVRVLVAPGEVVTAGKPLLVLEAMKMENEVKAPRDGTVRSLEVAPGQAVSTGDVLARLEAE